MDAKFREQRIKQIPATKIKTLHTIHGNPDNAKVKVQYIQNHQIIEINKDSIGPTVAKFENLDANEVEAESVEYLDESTSEDVHTSVTAPEIGNKNKVNNKHPKEPFKDTFYPNAIHCLIALYKTQYLEMKGKAEQQILALRVWDRITKEMNESYFNFSRSEIKEKFSQLRKQYFGVSNVEEIDAFEYFDQLHDIYQDKYIDAIAAGEPNTQESLPQQINIYQDEKLQLDEEHIVEGDDQELPTFAKTHEHNYPAAPAQEVFVETLSEIAHKENEFIDMVEKELHAIEEGCSVVQSDADTQAIMKEELGEPEEEIVSNEMILHQQEEIVEHEEIAIYTVEERQQHLLRPPIQKMLIKREPENDCTLEVKHAKRYKQSTVTPLRPMVTLHLAAQNQSDIDNVQDQPLNGLHHLPETTDPMLQKDLTLADYNVQQERRHQEKMELLRQSLLLQERALEMHQNLMEQLINRL